MKHGRGCPVIHVVSVRMRITKFVSCLFAVGIFASGCSAQTADPGNRTLRQMAADPILAALPPGSVHSKPITLSPAYNRRHGLFDGGCKCGPEVEMDVTTTQTDRELYDFYAKTAATTGWNVAPGYRPNFASQWNKTYPTGQTAILTMLLHVPTRDSYTLLVAY